MQRGFFYLVAVMDWASRKVLSWRLEVDPFFRQFGGKFKVGLCHS